MSVALDPLLQTSFASGHVMQEFWANVEGNDLSALVSLANFPDNPDGESRLVDLETPPVAGSSFGFRLVTLVTPPETGDYSFFLSSGSSANLYLSTDDDPANHSLLSQVLPAQRIGPSNWDLSLIHI